MIPYNTKYSCSGTLRGLLFILIVLSGIVLHAQQEIKGKVSSVFEPLAGVHIRIKSGPEVWVTEQDGSYNLSARPGDILVFSHTGYKTQEFMVEDVTRNLYITLEQEIQTLDNVTVTADKKKKSTQLEEEYFKRKDIIKTSFGYMDKRSAGGSVQILDNEDFNQSSQCILDILRNRMAGVQVLGNCQTGGSVIIRGRSSITGSNAAIYDVDGLIYTEAPIWINIFDITRIAVINSLGMNARYGTLGEGGVVVVNTKNGMNQLARKLSDPERYQNHQIYEEDALTQENYLRDMPAYYQAVLESNTSEEALERLEQYKKVYWHYPYFWLHAADAYYTKYEEPGFVKEVFETQFTLFEKNPVVLKALAYQLERANLLQEANAVYRRVYTLRTNYPQSYLDLGKSYLSLGELRKSAQLYLQLFDHIGQGRIVTDSATTKYLDRELIALHALNKEIPLSGSFLNQLIKENEFDMGNRRIVVEWNDSNADFVLEFVNPKLQSYLWEHQRGTDNMILKEKQNGVSSIDFFLDGVLPGTWMINVIYKGNPSEAPAYLKFTVYDDYGKNVQQSFSTYKTLSAQNVKQRCLELKVRPSSSK